MPRRMAHPTIMHQYHAPEPITNVLVMTNPTITPPHAANAAIPNFLYFTRKKPAMFATMKMIAIITH